MSWIRLAACAGALAALAWISPAVRAGELSAAQQVQYERSLGEMLAKASAERVMAEVEVGFLEERLAADDWALMVFEVEDDLIAELADDWMAVRVEDLVLQGRYGDQHPERVALAERARVLEDAVRRELGSVVEVRRLRLELAGAKEAEFLAALGGAGDDAVREATFAALVAQLRALKLEAEVEARHVERALDDGRGELLARSLPRGGLQVLLEARLDAAVEDAELALRYGDQHPERVELRDRLAELDRLLAAQVGQAAAATRLRVELLQRQIDALEALRQPATEEATP